ncbi:MAG TPA: ABC transporter permease [Candidatus Peribacteraceae bacterium]|nr:ABC transporter permease [Candidatus Peribacteraceae bacterium]
MTVRDLLKTASRGITINGMRTFLTMLGIIIGVASVVLMVSIGKTFQNYIITQIESVGANMMEVAPAGLEKFGGNLQSLTFEDYRQIAQLPEVQNVTPVIIVAKPVQHGKDQTNPLVFGAYNYIFDNYGLKLDHGRLLEQADEDGAKNNVVIGHQTAVDFFGDSDPVGQKINVGGVSFLVVGELQKQSSALLASLDSPVFMPFSTAKALTGQTSYLTYIALKTRPGEAQVAKDDITTILRQQHHITNPTNDPDKDDFVIQSAEQVTAIIGTVTLGLTLFLALVAGISLLVGGIGIMNIMLVSVTERTREIGLRKAVGAKKRDILLQFLFEAVFLTLAGGLIGIAVGMFFGWLLTAIAAKFLGQLTFILSMQAIVLAVGMAAAIGLVFGIYPARRASNLSPMEALRYE